MMWNILEHAERLINANQQVSLVTLVEAKGSTYRRQGAKMIVSHHRDTMGAISGGCLERDVAEHALQVLETNKPKLIKYELDDDVVFGLGLGCGGAISLLVEPLEEEWLAPIIADQNEVVLVKVIASEDDQINLGTHALYKGGELVWEKADLGLAEELIRHCEEAIVLQRSQIVELIKEGKPIRLYLDYLPLPNQLAIFGAGDDVIPVAKLAVEAGFKVIIMDHNPNNYSETRFPNTSFIRWIGVETIAKLDINNKTACLIMSHHIERDAKALEVLIDTDAYYIGLLGPRHRFERLVENHYTQDKQRVLNDSRIYAPVGLDIGSETSTEIAISIISEIIAVRNQQEAGFLRAKTGSIHS